MHHYQVYGFVCSGLVLTCLWAAPVSEKLHSAVTQRSANQVQDQEKQLKSLLSLVGKNIKLPNVAVQKSHVSHVESSNGQEVKHEVAEEKVTNSETGEVVSDITQDVAQSRSANHNIPHTVVETNINIPSEGVDKTVIEDLSKDETDESIEFTPTAVAQFLLETGKFQEFESSLEDLVNSAVMSQSEAESYRQDVMSEYQRLLAEIDAYESELAREDSVLPYFPESYPDMQPQKKSDLYEYQGGFIPEELSSENQQAAQDDLINNHQSLNVAIDAVLEQWWNQAFQAGDARAQALVEYLYNIVSKDDDMDDIGQIREILAEMLARTLMEDISVSEEAQSEISENENSDSNSQGSSAESNESTEDETLSEGESVESQIDDKEITASEESSEEPERDVSSNVKQEKSREDKTAKM